VSRHHKHRHDTKILERNATPYLQSSLQSLKDRREAATKDAALLQHRSIRIDKQARIHGGREGKR